MEFYHRCGIILDLIDLKRGSIKGLCMNEAKKTSTKKLGEAARFLKVIIQVLKYRPHLLHLITTTELMTLEPKLFLAPVWSVTPIKSGSASSTSKALKLSSIKEKKPRSLPSPLNLATIMVYDLLFSKRGLTLPKGHKVRKTLEKYQDKLEAEKEKEKKKKKLSSDEGLQIVLPEAISLALAEIGKEKKSESNQKGQNEEDGVGKVRWLRVNTIKWTVEECVEWFENERWELVDDVETMLQVATTKSKVFCLDAHIEPLLALPITLSLPSLLPYTDARLIAQDKASCMPAWVLLSSVLAEEDRQLEEDQLALAVAGSDAVPESTEEKEVKREKKRKNGVKVLDATAAPGNKTTMAAALAGEDGRVVAVERDAGRYKVLKEMCAKAGCSTVAPMNVDFLSIDPDDPKFKNITHFLVDPSCSGSGIPNRLDFLLPDAPPEESKQRVRALSNFQLTILSHAMRFSGARRVVYSTCSVWAQEDEGVVIRALAKKEFQDKGWTLAPRSEVVPTWERRGIVEECGGNKVVADSVLRCLPEDGTNGFFVACFVRTPPAVDSLPTATTDSTVDLVEETNETTTTSGGTMTMSHAERQEAFKAKARAKGGKHAKVVLQPTPTTTAASGAGSEGAMSKVKVVPMPSGGKTVVGNKARTGAKGVKGIGKTLAKVTKRLQPTAATTTATSASTTTTVKKEVETKQQPSKQSKPTGEMTLEEKVRAKKRKSFETLAGSVGMMGKRTKI